ncbi:MULTISPECIES: hypothetical protein [unclassified Wolbachia]
MEKGARIDIRGCPETSKRL